MAIIRLFNDLIMADHVIDAGEMRYYSQLREEFRFTREEEIEASQITLAQSFERLRGSEGELRSEIMKRCRDLSVSDGFCARSEALLITAADWSLRDDLSESGRVFSFPKRQFNIPDSCVLFIEGAPNPKIDVEVAHRYRALFSEFRLAGFEFVFIPHVVGHYRDSDSGLVDSIVRFVAPRLSEEGRRISVDKLLSMTTSEFTMDILCNKLGMESMRTTPPALFMKIGSSYVGDEIYSNYLRIDVELDILNQVRALLDEFTSMLSSDVLVVSNNREQRNQFLYTGFYKLLLDTHLLRRNVRSKVYIMPYSEDIYFPDIDTKLQGMHRREKALYVLMLVRSLTGGVRFSKPTTARQLKTWQERMDELQRQYGKIYGMFGGEPDKAPDLSAPSTRNPMMAVVRGAVGKLEKELHNVADYQVNKDENGVFAAHLEPGLVWMKDYASGEMIPLDEFASRI